MPDSEYDSCECDDIDQASDANSIASHSSTVVLHQNRNHHGMPDQRSPNSSSNKPNKPLKISGTAKVLKVTPKFAYISSDRYGSIFVLPKAVAHQFEEPNMFINLQKVLRVDEIVSHSHTWAWATFGGASCLYLHAIRCRLGGGPAPPHVKFLAWGGPAPPTPTCGHSLVFPKFLT